MQIFFEPRSFSQPLSDFLFVVPLLIDLFDLLCNYLLKLYFYLSHASNLMSMTFICLWISKFSIFLFNLVIIYLFLMSMTIICSKFSFAYLVYHWTSLIFYLFATALFKLINQLMYFCLVLWLTRNKLPC